MKGVSKLVLGILAIILAVLGLFYVFNSLHELSKTCKIAEVKPPICAQLSTFSISLMIVLVIIGAFLILAEITVYILISS